MPRPPHEQKAWELQAFGCLAADLEASKPPVVDNLMYAMSILSDAQELLRTGGNPESVRQFINRAKLFIDKERRATRGDNE